MLKGRSGNSEKVQWEYKDPKRWLRNSLNILATSTRVTQPYPSTWARASVAAKQ